MFANLRTRSVLALAGLVTAGSLLAAPGVASAAPCTSSTPGMIVDASANDGLRTKGAPPKFEYGESPYIGARYDKCLRTLKVYYGGYRGITHYNIRTTDGHQREVGAHFKGVWTPKGDELYRLRLGFSVQACNRGGTFEKSSCTVWSPTVKFPR